MLGAVMFGHEQMQVAIRAINELVAEAGVPAWDWQPPAGDRCQRGARRRRGRADRGLSNCREAGPPAAGARDSRVN
jgi:polyribonucleotide nucleotidyltransferase